MKIINYLDVWMRVTSLLDAIHAHISRHYLTYITALLGYWVFALHYEFSINVSNSLPGTLYIVEKGVLPSRGEYLCFDYPSDFIYQRNSHFLKRTAGVAGDVVQNRDHHFFVNGKPVGVALPTTSSGIPIEESTFTGSIPAGYYYVAGVHPKSLDSRYEAVGLIPTQIVVGRAFRIF